MSNISFVKNKKSLLIAPAGHGKTHALAECISICTDDKRQLILTHTHAGVASIKAKLKKADIDNAIYSVDTIMGFAAKYVNAFCGNVPPISDNNKYYPFVISKAKMLFSTKAISEIIRKSYSRLFVDEYQDCNVSQHEMVLELSKVLNTHLFGDPMQGIFNFNGDIVNFGTHLQDFKIYNYLNTPWRWDNNDRGDLGSSIFECREILEKGTKTIELPLNKAVEGLWTFICDDNNSKFDINNNYYKYLQRVITNKDNKISWDNLLIIVPEYKDDNGTFKGGIAERAYIKSRLDYGDKLRLFEAVDEKSYYNISSQLDKLTSPNTTITINAIKSMLVKLYNKGDIDKWINDNYIINKRGKDNIHSLEIKRICDKLILSKNYKTLYSLFQYFKIELKSKSIRTELRDSIIRCTHDAAINKSSIHDSMVKNKNIQRRSGRKVKGKIIGTTLLTKGLEFDTVVILDAEKITDAKHFYVAISRACKNLIIFTTSRILTFK